MAPITYITGDATSPHGPGLRVIAHCANNRGKWGSGFVLALSKKWPEPEIAYRNAHSYSLGSVQVVKVTEDIRVANLIGQDGIRAKGQSIPPVRYEALRKGFLTLAEAMSQKSVASLDPSIHMPRIASKLAGGDWALVEPLIAATFGKRGIEVFVYSLPGQSATNGGWFDSRVEGSEPFVR